jgi:biopolymer transport protein TolR
MLHTSRRRRHHSLPINAEINLTNLIDVAFVLLIIFIITAPIIQAGMEMQLPKAEAQPLESSEAVVVSVAQDQRIFLDENEVSLEEFPNVFAAYMKAHEGEPVSLQGDARVPDGRIITVLDEIKRAGHTDVNLILEPLPSSRRAR